MFIVLEGIDRAGKTSLALKLRERMLARSRPVSVFRQPTRDGAVGMLLRETFARCHTIDPLAMFPLFLADALDCEPYLRDRLDHGDAVICDRHTVVSGLVYQSDAHSMSDILAMTPLARFRRPDLCVILDIEPETYLRRVREGRPSQATDGLYEPRSRDRVEVLRARYALVPVVLPTFAREYRVIDANERTADELADMVFP